MGIWQTGVGGQVAELLSEVGGQPRSSVDLAAAGVEGISGGARMG